MNTITPLHQNLLLAALPQYELSHIAPYLELVQLKLGDKIYEPHVPMQYVYFPTTATISLLHVMEDGSSAEIAVVGKEGILGISLSIGSKNTLSCAVVQSGGFAFRLSGYRLKQAFFRAGPMHHQLVRYTQTLLTKMAETDISHRHHMLE